MILVDTTIWIDHFRRGDARLIGLLEQGIVASHPMIRGELAVGSLSARDTVLGLLADLPSVVRADDDEVLELIERRSLHGRGLGFVDAHLLASCLLTPGTRLWSRDRRLTAAGRELGV